MREVRVLADPAALAREASRHIVAAARAAVAAKGCFSLALAGGSTPGRTYELLAHAGGVDWPAAHVFWSDERCVPPDHAASNYRGAAEALLRHVHVPPERIHRMRGELPAGAAAAEYDALLAEFYRAGTPAQLLAEGRTGVDLVLLGVGADGHTASLFPGSPALEATGWTAAAVAPAGSPARDRISLTLAAIGAARAALVLVSGENKRAAVSTCLGAHPDDPAAPPAARARALVRTPWLLDAEAAGQDPGLRP